MGPLCTSVSAQTSTCQKVKFYQLNLAGEGRMSLRIASKAVLLFLLTTAEEIVWNPWPSLGCRGLQRDVVSICWPIAPSYTSPNVVQMREDGGGGGWVAGSQPMSAAAHITWHGALINFGDLPPYLTYAWQTCKPVTRVLLLNDGS